MNFPLDPTGGIKLSWAASLQAGDIVCDCRYNHVKIIKTEQCIIDFPLLDVYRALMFNWTPYWVERLLWKLQRRFIPHKIYINDYLLTLEGGRQCSAMDCCDPADHPEKHPDRFDKFLE